MILFGKERCTVTFIKLFYAHPLPPAAGAILFLENAAKLHLTADTARWPVRCRRPKYPLKLLLQMKNRVPCASSSTYEYAFLVFAFSSRRTERKKRRDGEFNDSKV